MHAPRGIYLKMLFSVPRTAGINFIFSLPTCYKVERIVRLNRIFFFTKPLNNIE